MNGPLYALAVTAIAIGAVVACKPADSPVDTDAMKDSMRKAGEVVKEKKEQLDTSDGAAP